MSKIVLIGANHAGTAAANTMLDNYPNVDLTVFDANSNISYLGCGTALWVGRQIQNPDSLFYCSKQALEAKGATVHMQTKAEQVDFVKKVVYAQGPNGKQLAEPYDKLILATGSKPIIPAIEGVDLPGVACVKLFQDGQKIDRMLQDSSVRSVAVVGAGYIGVEMAEAVKRRGKRALLFEAASTCLASYYDEPLCHEMDAVLQKNGVDVHYGEKVLRFEAAEAQSDYMGSNFLGYLNDVLGGQASASVYNTNTAAQKERRVAAIVTDKGRYPVDLVILAIGFRPNTALGGSTLKTIANGAYQVNKKQQASLPNVYAIGDCATVYSNALQDSAYIALATNAVRSGVVAGHNACGTPLESVGVQGSNGICIFDYKMVSTGLNMKAAKNAGFDPVLAEFEDYQKPAFITQDNERVKLRILYDRKTRRVLGAQMASYQDMSMGIHMFSLAINEGVTIDKLKLLDIFFLPHFNQPYNYITMAALGAQ